MNEPAESGFAISDIERKTATAAAFTGLFAYSVTLSVGPASLNAIGKAFRVDGKQLAVVFFLHALGFLLAIAFGALAARRVGKQAAVVVGCLLMSAGCVVFAFAPTYVLLLPAMLLLGSGGGFAEPMAMALVSEAYPGRKRTTMMNYSQVAFGVGAVGSPLVVGWALANGVDWRTGFFSAAGICFAAAVVGSLRMNMRARLLPRKEGGKVSMRDPLLLALAAGMFLYVGAELGTANWLAKFFADALNANGPLAAGTVSIFWGGVTVGRYVAGVVARHFADVTIIRVSLLSAIVWQVTLLSSHSPMSAALVVGLLGLSMAAVWPTILAHAGDMFAHRLESTFSVIVAAGCLGAVVVPPAIGAASDAVGWRMAFAVCPALGLTNILLFTAVARKGCKR